MEPPMKSLISSLVESESPGPTSCRGRAPFIVLEGPNASGKTTLLGTVFDTMRTFYPHPVRIATDPISAPSNIARDVLDGIRNAKRPIQDPVTEALLYSANRWYLWQAINKALDRGFPVVCDRWWPSTAIYQSKPGSPDHLTAAQIVSVNRALGIGNPDLLIVLDPGPTPPLRRMEARYNEPSDPHTYEVHRMFYLALGKVFATPYQSKERFSHILRTDEPLESTRRDVVSLVSSFSDYWVRTRLTA